MEHNATDGTLAEVGDPKPRLVPGTTVGPSGRWSSTRPGRASTGMTGSPTQRVQVLNL